MSRLHQFEVEARSTARPEVVFDVVCDATTWQRWAGPLVPASRWEQGGLPQGGVGAIARLGLGPLAVRVMVLELEPPRRLAFEVLTWQPYRDYLGEVQLEQDGGGTRIRWVGGFRARVPGTGTVQRRVLERLVGDLAGRLARHTSA